MIDLVKMGNLLSVTRREKGYTQDELGSRLGVSAQAISKWERGMSLPDTDMLPDISRVLGISVDYLLGITDFNSNDTPFAKDSKQNPYVRENPLDFLLPDELTIVVSNNLFRDNESSILHEMDNIMKGIPALRNEMALKRGLLIPIVRLIDSLDIPDNTYQILVRSRVESSGSICNGECHDISTTILAQFKEVVIKNAELLTHKQALKAIIENMKSRYPIVVDELIPHKINYDTLHKIIILLINKGYAIRDMLTILEVINNCVETTSDIQTIVSEIEKSLIKI